MDEQVYTITESQLASINKSQADAQRLFWQLNDMNSANVRMMTAAFRLYRAVQDVDPMYLSVEVGDAMAGFRAAVEENVVND